MEQKGVRVGRRVRAARLQRGWTQLELSDISKVSVRTVQYVEHGILPQIRTRIRLARALGVTREWLEEEGYQ